MAESISHCTCICCVAKRQPDYDEKHILTTASPRRSVNKNRYALIPHPVLFLTEEEEEKRKRSQRPDWLKYDIPFRNTAFVHITQIPGLANNSNHLNFT